MTLAAISRACEAVDHQALHISTIASKPERIGLLQTLYCYHYPSCEGPAIAETQILGLPSNRAQKLLIWSYHSRLLHLRGEGDSESYN